MFHIFINQWFPIDSIQILGDFVGQTQNWGGHHGSISPCLLLISYHFSWWKGQAQILSLGLFDSPTCVGCCWLNPPFFLGSKITGSSTLREKYNRKVCKMGKTKYQTIWSSTKCWVFHGFCNLFLWFYMFSLGKSPASLSFLSLGNPPRSWRNAWTKSKRASIRMRSWLDRTSNTKRKGCGDILTEGIGHVYPICSMVLVYSPT